MAKIKSIHLSKLLKMDLPDLAEKVIRVVNEHEPELLKIKEAYDLLADMQPQIDLLKSCYGPHLITKELKVLRVKRTTYISLITFQMRALSKTEMEGDNASVILAHQMVNLHLKDLKNRGDGHTIQHLSEFFRKIEENEELEAAFDSLGMTNYLDELQSVHSTIDELLEARKASIAARPTISMPPIAKSVRNALRNLFFQINVAQEQNVELDYSLLISNLNMQLNVYRTAIGIRTAINNKKRAEEAIDNEEGVEENDSVIDEGANEPEDPIETTQFTPQMMHVSAENVNVNGNGFNNGELGEKKTAASSSIKHEQLPIINERGMNM